MLQLAVDDEITIRTLHPDDSHELFALLERNRARLRRWIHPSSLPETASAARKYAIECYFNSLDPLIAIDTLYIDEVIPYYPPSDPSMEMGIWLRGVLAGVISLSVMENRSGAAEFGYWITEEAEGKGIVTRCVGALMDHAIEQMGIQRFIIGCAAGNRRSRAVPERLGYDLAHTIPNGEVIAEFVYDRVVYEMESNAWRQGKREPIRRV
jgi:ribosomal-protein-serine acetyltransferase